MKLKIKRVQLLDKCTIGYLFIDGVDTNLFTLEPKVRDVKVEGATAIPLGTYKVIVDYSAHFERELPHVLNVPNFEGVRIHPGNTDKDTQGCILIGSSWAGGDFIGHSKDGFIVLFAKIKGASHVELEIA